MISSRELQTGVEPVTKAARIASLDVLRGIAVLGILLMNIIGFGLLPQAYVNPLASGGADGLNGTIYSFMTVGFEGTMRGFFSLLFGASLVLLTERMEKSGAGLMTAEIHFRRMLWLMVFGIIHWSLLLWFGEILFLYSMCGLLLFALRKLSPRSHLIVGLVLLGIAALAQTLDYHDVVETKIEAAAAQTAKAAGERLDSAQTDAIAAWEDRVSQVVPTAESAEQSRNWHSGSYWNAVSSQFSSSYDYQWKGAPFLLFFDVIPFMFLGMGLLKIGILGGQSPLRTYLMMIVGGYGIGIPLGLYELDILHEANFDTLAFANADQTYQISRLAMVTGHIGIALLMIRQQIFPGLQRLLAATGQMALSNYLAQTILCVTLFYGFGFGLYETFQRYELYFVVGAIWAVQIMWSVIWLRHFRFGPFEWLWRSLTYWQRQPMKIS